jgi:hypothetical protein
MKCCTAPQKSRHFFAHFWRPFIISCQGVIIENKLQGALTWKKDLILEKAVQELLSGKKLTGKDWQKQLLKQR